MFKTRLLKAFVYIFVVTCAIMLAYDFHLRFEAHHISGIRLAIRLVLFSIWNLCLFVSLFWLLKIALVELADVSTEDHRLVQICMLALTALFWWTLPAVSRNPFPNGPVPRHLPPIIFLSIFFVGLVYYFGSNLIRNFDISRLKGLKWVWRALVPLAVILVEFGGDRVFINLPQANRNVILISIDTLRPDFLGCYGAPDGKSTAIDQLAKDGVLFRQAYSTSPWTVPSHMTMMTGLFPKQHAVNPTLLSDVLAPGPEIPMLAEIFQQNNYETAAFAGGGFLGRHYGFHRGFDIFQSEYREGIYVNIEQAKDFIETRDPRRPFFLFIHSWEVHDYFSEFGEGWDGYFSPVPLLKQTYFTRIASTDYRLMKFLRALKKKGYGENTLIIITSDHGEGFREHDLFGHRNSLYDELLRIPLIMVGPDIPADQEITAPVSLVDLMPTVLEWAGADVPAGMQERSILDADRHAARGNRDIIFSEFGSSYSIRTDNYKYINCPEQDEELLFDNISDPKETLNLVDKQHAVLQQFRLMAGDFIKDLKPGKARKKSLTKELADQIEALGYIQ